MRDIALGQYADWGGAERIVINVDYFYRRFRGDETQRYAFDFLEPMAHMVMRARP